MNINKKTKDVLWVVFVVVFLVVFVFWMLASPRPDHIEDTNGKDNYILQTITERDVVDQKMNYTGVIAETETEYPLSGFSVSSGKKYSSKKFTGVYRLYAATLFKGSDIYVSLGDFKVKEGNFAFYVVFDGKVVGKILPTESTIPEFTLKNVEKTATLEYVIAGESANFSFVAPTEID